MSTVAAELRIDPYEVEVEVVESSVAARGRASTEALLITLSRVSGLASIPRTPEIVAALEAPARFYSQFAFADDGVSGQSILRITFESRLVLDLIDRAGLPVWWSRRPSVVAWIVLDNGEPRLLGAGAGHALTTLMSQRALFRGLPLEIPLLDLDDTLRVSETDVFSKTAEVLEAASTRYGADLVLTGRVKERFSIAHGSVFSGDWEVWVAGQPVAHSFSDLTAVEAANAGIDMVADHLFGTYAVLSRRLVDYDIAVAGLDGAQSYVALMDYLINLEFVAQVGVTSVTPRAIQLKVASRAGFEQLMMLLTHDGLLREDAFHRGPGLQFVWLEGQALN